ncbi:MAG: DUF1559 domain-containing protein, partial [Planctomycetales bacterium]|nr:DUF1559 domain-containing protein [Planctomycetales bacterium]
GPPRTSGKAVASLVLGICSFFFSVLTGIPAIILGLLSLRDIDREPLVDGKGLAVGGITTGAIGSVLCLGCLGLQVALLLPAVQAARGAAQRAESMNNLKQLCLAALNYESANRSFPPSGKNEDGMGSQLSWRVQLLPYLETQTGVTFDDFHHDEPWDSPHNKTLIDKMPAVFACNSADLPPGHTVYLGVSGPGAIFRGDSNGTRLRDVTDGLSQTMIFVEADPTEAVPWTKPEDWECDPNNPFAGVGGLRPGGFLAAMGDGSVHFIPNQTPPGAVQAAATSNAGDDASAL